MGFYKTEAIVLRTREWREADQLVTLLSPDLGRFKVVARGARKPRSRLRGGIQPFTQARLMLHTGRSIDILTGSDTCKCFYFREDLEKLTWAVYWADLLNRLLPEREPNPAVYFLFLQFLYLLESIESINQERVESRILNHLFELKLISLVGYRPELTHCVNCQKALSLTSEQIWFSPARGGTVCRLCSQALGSGALPVSSGTLALLKHWLRMDARQFRRVRPSGSNLKELERLLPAFLEYHLEQGLPSRKLVRNLVDKE
ncbi:MAG: DNA repair protein RecO [Syntrophomonadaceae bacterium]|nr:DNA repair protein RecO [Syntrophomonadaceae bacterium]